jgi:CopG family transcriptional regulator, nickel-responsive regulator
LVAGIVRFGVSLDKDLLRVFDHLISTRGYSNRSEAIRDLIRQDLIAEEWKEDADVAGAITLVYDHHRRDLLNRITTTQHDFQTIIVSTQHIHLDHYNCLEIVAVRGKAGEVKRLGDLLRSLKGVKHGTLSMTGTGKGM